MHTPRASRGFTLLELMAAASIFALLGTTILVFMDSSSDHIERSVKSRELRVLAEQKLGEIEIFEEAFDTLFGPGEKFDDSGDRWEGWSWGLDIRDVVIFGSTSDENAEYLFGDPEEAEEDDPAAPDPAEQPREGETQYLREVTLTVKAPDDGGGSNDSVTIVTFLPLVDYGAANPAGGTGTGGGGGGK